MKYCPRCNFTFPDFHHVCDFDGSDLVPEPERASLVNSSKRLSIWRRCVKSPVLLAAVGLFAVVSSAVLIGYLDLVIQTNRVAADQATPTTSDSTVADLNSPQSMETSVTAPLKQVRHSNKSSAVSSSRHQIASARLAQATQPNVRMPQSERVRERNAEQNSREKEPKLTAMLKTTWHVLKKPFKF